LLNQRLEKGTQGRNTQLLAVVTVLNSLDKAGDCICRFDNNTSILISEQNKNGPDNAFQMRHVSGFEQVIHVIAQKNVQHSDNVETNHIMSFVLQILQNSIHNGKLTHFQIKQVFDTENSQNCQNKAFLCLYESGPAMATMF